MKEILTSKQLKLIGQYPIKDGHRKHYVKYPLQLSPRVFVAVRVSIYGGYLKIDADRKRNPTIVPFKSEAECQKACDIHNNYHFNPYGTVAGERRIMAILEASFHPGLSKSNSKVFIEQ